MGYFSSKAGQINTTVELRVLKLVYNQWRNIMEILKSVFKDPPLPLYNVASRQHSLTHVKIIIRSLLAYNNSQNNWGYF